MNTDNAIRSAVGFFLVILLGAIVSSVLGGMFALVLAGISPDFISSLFGSYEGPGTVRCAVVVGMIWGLFIGAAVSGFSCFLAALLKIVRIHLEYRSRERRGIES